VANMHFDSAIKWAGIVLVMADGSKRAMEMHNPSHAQFQVRSESWQAEPEISVCVTGYGSPWRYGEQAEPTGPVKAITEPTPEIETFNEAGLLKHGSG
jgi:hypothetical protein